MTTAQRRAARVQTTDSVSEARQLVQLQACGEPGCPCAKAERAGEGVTHCVAHPDEHPSMTVSTHGDKLLVHCFTGCEKGALFEAARERLSESRPQAASARRNGNGRGQTDKAGKTQVFVVRDPSDGTPVAELHRKSLPAGGKKVWWTLPGGVASNGQIKPASLPLYRMHDVVKGRDDGTIQPGSRVVVVEGPKVADRLWAAGIPCVATVTGASTVPSLEQLRELASFAVTLSRDNDPPGQRHMQEIGRRVHSFSTPLMWLEPREGDPPGHDLGDVASDDELRERLAEAQPWQPAAEQEPAPVAAGAAKKERPTRIMQPVVTTAAHVVPTRLSWLWRGYAPLGKPMVLDGDPGLGKSTLTLDLAARISRGALMPDGSQSDLDGPAGVLLVSAEDDQADTSVPRLIAARADLSRVHFLDGVQGVDDGSEDSETDGYVRPWDMQYAGALASAIKRYDAKLCIVDPLMAHVPSKTNANQDSDVRRLLRVLADHAANLGCTILLVRHLTKGGGSSAVYRGGGSIGIIGAARMGLLVTADPDDETARLLAVSKTNLGQSVPTLRWRLESAGDVARVRWEGATDHTADALLAHAIQRDQAARNGESGVPSDAVEVVRQALANGPRRVTELFAELAEDGITVKEARRAKEKLNVANTRIGFGPGSYSVWTLPGCEQATDAP